MKLYDILGLTPEASNRDIKKAFRDLSKIHHPDKGGDEEDFKEVYEAYSLLSDEGSRERYDSGESVEEINGKVDGLMTRVFHVFEEVINSAYFVPDHSDLFKLMRQECNEKEMRMRSDIETLENEVKNVNSIIARFKNADVFVAFMNKKNSDLIGRVENIKQEMSFIEKVINYISDCQYSYDEDKEDIKNGTHKFI